MTSPDVKPNGLTPIFSVPDNELDHLLSLGLKAIEEAQRLQKTYPVSQTDYTDEIANLKNWQARIGTSEFHQIEKKELYGIVGWARMYTVQQRLNFLINPPLEPTKIIMDPIADKWGPAVDLPLDNSPTPSSSREIRHGGLLT